MWAALRANGTRRARPASLPSAASAMWPSACTGAIVIGPAGAAIPARAKSQPAIRVSANGAGTAKRPAARNTANPSAIVAPAPPSSSGTQATVSPDSSSASHSAFGHTPFSVSLIVAGSHRSRKIRVAVSTMILSRLSLIPIPALLSRRRRS